MSGDGSLFGQRIHHVAALAATCRETTDLPQGAPSRREVASYARFDGAPFRVVHDPSINRPYGSFVVYVGEQRIGAQLSFPSADDCRRMASPPPLSTPYEQRVSPAARLALGMITNKDSNPKAREIAIKRARAQFRATSQTVFRKAGK